MKLKPFLALAMACGALLGCSDSALGPGEGRIALRLTDAPFPLNEVESINMFIVRVEARVQATSEEDAALDIEEDDAEENGWIVLATPNDHYDLMDLRNGVTAFLGDEAVPVGVYQSIRLILDTEQSSVTLKNGTVLTGASSPSIKFPSAGQSGIKVLYNTPIVVADGETVDVLLDFDAEESFVLRGNTILQNGLLFKPVIKATVSND